MPPGERTVAGVRAPGLPGSAALSHAFTDVLLRPPQAEIPRDRLCAQGAGGSAWASWTARTRWRPRGGTLPGVKATGSERKGRRRREDRGQRPGCWPFPCSPSSSRVPAMPDSHVTPP